jgi:hypothetical protein
LSVHVNSAEARAIALIQDQNNELRWWLTSAICEHVDRAGGNDYILCNRCGLMWDYRREGPTQEVARYVAAVLADTEEPR